VKDTTYIVHGLTLGHTYEFRVKAKNAAGFSNPSHNSSSLHLKDKFKIPSPPGTPTVVKVGKSYVDLKWDPPTSDGGSRIMGYIIEKREVGGALWVKCNDYNVLECKFTAINLVERADYEFRITAFNSVGKSEPSSCSTPVKICESEGGEKPEFIVPLNNQVVPFGKLLTLQCEVQGKPMPKARWLKNGRDIITSAKFRTEAAGGVFRLHFNELTELDDGDYTCEAYNSAGHATTTAHIKIGSMNIFIF
jgi:hypothetical protein